MREMSVREANQNFSQVIAAAERGETIIVTKNGKPVAKITPRTGLRIRSGALPTRHWRPACGTCPRPGSASKDHRR